MEMILIVLIGVGVAGAIAWAVVRGGGKSDPHLDPDPGMIEATDAKSAGAVGNTAVEAEITRYREALRAGTVCPRCSFANAAGSRFCSECGSSLEAAADAPA